MKQKGPHSRGEVTSVRLCVVGGKLQGIEALYLAKKAGFETLLIDRRVNPPASGLAEEFYRLDVSRKIEETKKIISHADAVLPALEDIKGLDVLKRICSSLGVPYLQDNSAFGVTADKLASIRFFEKLNIPYPKLYPKAGFPLIVKPVSGSGSQAVYLARNQDELKEAVMKVRRVDEHYMIQEHASGRFLSLELHGFKGEAYPMQITALEFDENFGCKRVLAPCSINETVKHEIITIGRKIVKGLKLTGLTDLQVVTQGEIVKVLEINARLPSQTPTVVYHSVGLNMVELLFKSFKEKKLPKFEFGPEKAVIYQHVRISNGVLKVVAENFLSKASGLRLEQNFFGVNEAITNFPERSRKTKNCVATLIVKEENFGKAKKLMREAVQSIIAKYELSGVVDKSPPGIVV